MARRFYEEVNVTEVNGGFIVRLDAHELKTPAKKPLVMPTVALAQHVADEWRAQETDIDSYSMPTMRLVSTALDRVWSCRNASVVSTLLSRWTVIKLPRPGRALRISSRR